MLYGFPAEVETEPEAQSEEQKLDLRDHGT